MSLTCALVMLLCGHAAAQRHALVDETGEDQCVPICSEAYKSCADIKQRMPNALSGLYNIQTNVGRIEVYCEMVLAGGGFTFLPRKSIISSPQIDLSEMIRDTSKVLLRYQATDTTQPYTLIEQLPRYGSVPMSIQVTSHEGYSAPANRHRLGPYLYLGIIPRDMANRRTKQGFSSNGQVVDFMNCDQNPNSHFAFFPNHDERSPQATAFHMYTLIQNWLNSAKPVRSHRVMPNDFFFFTEMHFGGCGAYWESGHLSAAPYGKRVEGVAIGFH